jgi:hypothetical protein
MTRTSMRRFLIAATMAVAMMGSSVAEAAPRLRTVPAQLDKADEKKYGDGRSAYEKGDYGSAAKTFSGIMNHVPESAANRTIRASLVLVIMAAYQAAYEGSGDIAMLKAGMDAYYNYFRAYRDAHASTNIPESVVDARFVMKEALGHAEANKNGGTTTNTNGGTTTTGNSGNEAAAKPASGGAAGSTDDSQSSSTTLIASGAVLLALGVGATAMIGIGAVEGKRAREDGKLPGYTDEQRDGIDKRGRSMNSLLIAGAVTAPVLAIAGISLVVVGAKSKRKAQLALAPSVTRRFAGVVLRGRF